MSISSLFSSFNPKSLVQTVVCSRLNSLLGEAGSVSDLSIHLDQGEIQATLDLAGESEPVTLTAHGVEILDDGRITVESLTGSREWITILADRHLKDTVLEVPEEHRKKIRLLSSFLG